ncbi:MAG: phosphodiester glycosidase family protein [Candidatus Cybelea sp.]
MFGGIKVGGYRTYALTEVLQATDPVLAVSGATGSSLSLPASLGLVIDNGRLASALDRSAQFAKGVLCIGSNGQPSIVYAKAVSTSRCEQAMQSGPLIIEPGGKVGIYADEQQRTALEHIVVAIDHGFALHIIASTASHLYDLAQYFHRLKFAACLNISSGIDHAALVIRTSKINYKYGNPDGSIPSALIMTHS